MASIKTKYSLPIEFILCFLILACKSDPISSNSYAEKIQKELKEKYDNPSTTPLREDEIADFKGITFFPIKDDYKIIGNFTPSKNEEVIDFPTSAEKIKQYKNYGTIDFKIKGKPYQLTVYQPFPIIENHEDHLFIPFTDLTNGINSYGGGRYLDLKTTDITKQKIVLDFNLAYNPYCAYSKYYNCPIPPANNHLDTEIEAGVSFTENH